MAAAAAEAAERHESDQRTERIDENDELQVHRDVFGEVYGTEAQMTNGGVPARCEESMQSNRAEIASAGAINDNAIVFRRLLTTCNSLNETKTGEGTRESVLKAARSVREGKRKHLVTFLNFRRRRRRQNDENLWKISTSL